MPSHFGTVTSIRHPTLHKVPCCAPLCSAVLRRCLAALQVTVIELYDATPRDLSIEAIILGRTQHAARVSSYTSLQLEVLSQSFFLQHAITGMTVSQTLQGITTKQLLLHTQHDQVCVGRVGVGLGLKQGRRAVLGAGPQLGLGSRQCTCVRFVCVACGPWLPPPPELHLTAACA